MNQRKVVPVIFCGMLFCMLATTAEASMFLAFTPDPARGAGETSAEGCATEPGLARGLLTASSSSSSCHSGQWGTASPGVFAGESETDTGQATALFDTAPLGGPLSIGGAMRLVVYYYTTNQDDPVVAGQSPTTAYLEYAINEVTSSGSVTTISSGSAFEIPGEAYPSIRRGEAIIQLPAYTVAAGNRLRVSLTSAAAPDGRLLYGDASTSGEQSFSDAGITLETGGSGSSGGTLGGALPLALFAPLLVGVLARRLRISESGLRRTCPCMRSWVLIVVIGSAWMPAAHAGTFLAFTPDAALERDAMSPEGCQAEASAAKGSLTPSSAATSCHSGQLGTIPEFALFTGDEITSSMAQFTTPRLAEPLDVGGPARLVVYYAVTGSSVPSEACTSSPMSWVKCTLAAAARSRSPQAGCRST